MSSRVVSRVLMAMGCAAAMAPPPRETAGVRRDHGPTPYRDEFTEPTVTEAGLVPMDRNAGLRAAAERAWGRVRDRVARAHLVDVTDWINVILVGGN